MAYRLDLVNRMGLFKYYASWYEDGNMIDNSHNSIVFRITSLVLSIEKIKLLEQECILQFNLFENSFSIDKSVNNISFSSPSLYEILLNISESLSSLRILQNNIVSIISKKESNSYPSSLNDFIKKINNYNLDSNLQQIILDYWNKGGKLLKDYRDIHEHFDFLFNRVFISDTQNKHLKILLPDNPEVKNNLKFTFDENIDSINFIISEFYAIENLLNNISKFYKYNESSFEFTTKLDENNLNSLSVLFDPFKDLLIGLEAFKTSDNIKQFTHVAKIDLNKFSFVKIPRFFENKVTFEKKYELQENES